MWPYEVKNYFLICGHSNTEKHKPRIPKFLSFFREAFGGSNNFFLQVEVSIRTPEKFGRDFVSWSWRSIHRKLRIGSGIRKSYFKWYVFGTAKSSKLETYRHLSRTLLGVCSSYSAVLKYYPVLQNCRIWASSDHWWWRYRTFYFLLLL